jgi:AcrR family transcriptional regulator
MIVEELGTRDRILALAVAALDEGGDAAVRVKAITDEAGVGVTSLYHFFGHREGLIEAAQAERFHRGQTQLLAAFAEAVARCTTRDDFRQAIRRSVEVVGSPERAHDRLARASALGATIGHPRLQARLVAGPHAGETLGDILVRAQRNGWIDPGVDASAVADWCSGVLFGRVLLDPDP